AMAGDFLRSRADISPVLPRRIVDLDCARRCFYRSHWRRKNARPRHHLRLFWARQQELELLHTSRAGSSFVRERDFADASCSWEIGNWASRVATICSKVIPLMPLVAKQHERVAQHLRR